MDIRTIKKLIELINETGVGEIEVKSGEESVRISRMTATSTTTPVAYHPAPMHHTADPSSQLNTTESKLPHAAKLPEGHAVKSPMVGTVYLASTPGAKPFAEIGQHVAIGDTLCLIEAMKMFNKIEADKAGILSARMVENEQPVEYDQTLFIIEERG